MVLGLVPDCEPEKVTAAGNAAGTGARIALLNRRARTEIEEVVRRVEKVETAVEPRFQEHFVGAMGIPHRTAPYPRLAEVVALPERTVARRGRPPAPPSARRHTIAPRNAPRNGRRHRRPRRATTDRRPGRTPGRARGRRTPSACRSSRGR